MNDAEKAACAWPTNIERRFVNSTSTVSQRYDLFQAVFRRVKICVAWSGRAGQHVNI